jgi:hypothetical protein
LLRFPYPGIDGLAGTPIFQARKGTIDRSLHGGAFRRDGDEVRGLPTADLLALRTEAFAMRDFDLAIEELERYHSAAFQAFDGSHGTSSYCSLREQRVFTPSNSFL